MVWSWSGPVWTWSGQVGTWSWTGPGLVLPDGLVPDPAGITLVQTPFEGGLELVWTRDDGSNRDTGLDRLLIGQRVAPPGGTVVEHHTWGDAPESG